MLGSVTREERERERELGLIYERERVIRKKRLLHKMSCLVIIVEEREYERKRE